MAKSAGSIAGVILKFAIILFILFLGLTDIMKGGKFGNITNPFAIESIKDIGVLGKAKNLSMVFGVVEVVCAVFLCIAMFVDLKGITPIASLIIMIIWTLRIILVSFVWHKIPNRPEEFVSWFTILMLQLIVLIALWATSPKKS